MNADTYRFNDAYAFTQVYKTGTLVLNNCGVTDIRQENKHIVVETIQGNFRPQSNTSHQCLCATVISGFGCGARPRNKCW